LNLSAKEQTFKITDEVVGEFSTYLGKTITFDPKTENKLEPWGYSVMVSLKIK
jgi:hypothetical protein